jgi:hypothetical protein
MTMTGKAAVRLPASHTVALVVECREGGAAAAKALTALTLGSVERAARPNHPDAPGDLHFMDPSRLELNATRNLSDQAVWEKRKHDLSLDVVGPLGPIFAAASSDGEASFFKLTQNGLNYVNGRYRLPIEPPRRGHKHNLVLPLPDVAGVAGFPSLVIVRVTQISLLRFATEAVVAVVRLAIEGLDETPLPIETLPLTVRLLCDARRDPVMHWRNDGTPSATVSIRSMLQRILSTTGVSLSQKHRIYSYSAVVLDDEIEPQKRHDLAYRLSRHYSYNYAMPQTAHGSVVYQPFENVLHVGSFEGFASVIQLGSGSHSEFEQNWIRTAFEPSYLPIAMLAFHEKVELSDLAENAVRCASFRKNGKIDDDRKARLRRLLHRYHNFGLAYRPAIVSTITMHNAVFDILRSTLGTDRLSRKVFDDVAESSRSLSIIATDNGLKEQVKTAKAQRRRREQWRWHNAIIQTSLAVLAILALFKAIDDLPSLLPFIHRDVAAVMHAWAPGLGVIIAIGIGGLAWFKSIGDDKSGDDDEDEGGEISDDAGEELSRARVMGSA